LKAGGIKTLWQDPEGDRVRIAVVSDFHGNRIAFEAVLADLRQISPDLVFMAETWPPLVPVPLRLWINSALRSVIQEALVCPMTAIPVLAIF
jgi:hypothetical protein